MYGVLRTGWWSSWSLCGVNRARNTWNPRWWMILLRLLPWLIYWCPQKKCIPFVLGLVPRKAPLNRLSPRATRLLSNSPLWRNNYLVYRCIPTACSKRCSLHPHKSPLRTWKFWRLAPEKRRAAKAEVQKMLKKVRTSKSCMESPLTKLRRMIGAPIVTSVCLTLMWRQIVTPNLKSTTTPQPYTRRQSSR